MKRLLITSLFLFGVLNVYADTDNTINAINESELSATFISISNEWSKSLVDYILKRAEEGDADAQASAAFLYMQDKFVEKEYNTAYSWARKGAKQKSAYAQYALGICHYAGRGVKQNYKKAVKYFKLAQKQGLKEAIFTMGALYLEGEYLKKDIDLGLATVQGDIQKMVFVLI